MTQPNVVVLLIVIATAVAFATRRVPVPYTVALVLTGVGLGALHFIGTPILTKQLLFTVLLPGLVFEAALPLPVAELKRNAGAIAALAIPGVIASIAITAVVLTAAAHVLGPDQAFTWQQALAFGGIVAATDPVAVVSLVRTLGVPRRFALLLEAESLLNDGTAIVFVGLILAAGATSGPPAAWTLLTIDFMRIVGLGVLIGLAFGAVASWLTRAVDEATIEITLTVIAAYGSFAAADQIGGSGVIATMVAGVVYGHFGARGMSAATRAAAQSFWDYVAFLLNSVVFLLIGFQVQLPNLLHRLPLIVIALVAGWVSRGAIVGAVATATSLTDDPIPRRWVVPLVWGGLRGGLSMVLALGLPETFAGRELVITVTAGFVVASILLQGTTMTPLLRASKLIASA